MLVGEFDEDIFQRRSERADFRDDDALLQQLRANVFQIEVVVDQRVDGLPENRGAANAGNGARNAQGAGYFRSGDFDAIGAGWLHFGQLPEFIRRAVGDEFAEIDVRDVTAALGFVHVVRG